ncbi:MAG: hypothetical protein ACE5KX_02675 [Acidimicrobiia bacterium]
MGGRRQRGVGEMDFSKLTNGQKVALSGGVVLIVNLFLPWYKVGPFRLNAFDADFLAWGGSFFAIAAAVVLGAKAFGRLNDSAWNLRAEQIALLLGAVGTVLIILRWITENDFVSFGLFVGIIAAAATTYGALMAVREEGLELPKADDFRRGDGPTGGYPPSEGPTGGYPPSGGPPSGDPTGGGPGRGHPSGGGPIGGGPTEGGPTGGDSTEDS